MEANPLTGKAALSLSLSTAGINAYEGAVRSGKTFASLIDWLRFIRYGPAGNLLMTGRTERTIINNLVMPLQDMLGRARVRINRGTGVVNILGRDVMVIGANNEAARTKIQGLTLAGAYVDECSTLPESYFNMLWSRLSVAGAQLWLTTNPEGPAHWLKVNWLDRAKLHLTREGNITEAPDGLDLHRFSFTIDDNPNLPADYVKRIKESYVGLWYRRFILGEWVAAEGAIFETWNPDAHVVPYGEIPAMRRVLALGIDYGVTNATAGILVGVGQDNRLYALDEWRRAKRQNASGLTISEVTADMRAWLNSQPAQPSFIAVDPSAAELKLELHRARLTGVMDADNDVVYGIRTLASLLSADRIRVTDRCTGLIGEIPGYSWDPKATEKGDDKPLKVADHSLDGWRYAITSTETIWRPWVSQPTL